MTASRPNRPDESGDMPRGAPLPRRERLSSGHAPARVSPAEQAAAEASRGEVLAEVRGRAEAGLRPRGAWLDTGAGEAAARPARDGRGASASPGVTGQSSHAAEEPVAAKRRLRRPGKVLLIGAAAAVGVLACAVPLLLAGGRQHAVGPEAGTESALSPVSSPEIRSSPPGADPTLGGSQASRTPTARTGPGVRKPRPARTAPVDMPSGGTPPSGHPAPLSAPASPVASATNTSVAVPVRNQASGLCIDVTGDSGRPDGTQLQLWECTGVDWQLWRFMSDGTVRSLDKCMDVVAPATAGGARVDWTTCNGSSSQRFTLNSAQNLVNVQTDKCVDTVNGQTANGTPLQLSGCGGQDSQKWSVG
jgi:hypothetical protein